MTKTTPPIIAPKLRFPGFTGAWQVKQLGEVLRIPTKDKVKNPNTIELLTVRLHCKGVVRSGNFPKSTLKGRPYYKRNKGELLIGKQNFQNGGLGIVGQNENGFIASNAIASFEAKQDIKFIFYYLSRKTFYKNIGNYISGTGQKEISEKKINQIKIAIPPLAEQQQIADCLSSLDDLITTQGQKVDLLKQHKKGLLQNLFPADGKTVPKLRFPGFTGAWQVKQLGEVADFFKGKGISKADITADGKQPCIRYGELYTLYNETIEQAQSYTNLSMKNLVLSKANDVIIPSSGETQEDIATASCVINSGIALGGDLNIIRSKINGIFLSYYLNSVKKKSIAQLSQGISVIHLYSSQLKKLDVSFPLLPEQQKIADCLSSLDDLITTEQQKLTAYKTHKKGLLQNLFPASDSAG